MSELVPSLDVQHPLTLLERRRHGPLTLYCCIARRRSELCHASLLSGPVRVLSGLVMWCVLYDLAVCCAVFMTLYGTSKPTCETRSTLARSVF